MSIYEDHTILFLCCMYAALIGAVLGSFINCTAKRIVTGESFFKGRSHCANPECGHILSFPDLIPVFSWIFLKGRCRYCGDKISIRYPLTEIGFALVSVLCLLRFDLSLDYVRAIAWSGCLLCLALVDFEIYVVPDGCLLLSLITWIVTAPFLSVSRQEIIMHALAALCYCIGFLLLALCMDRLFKRESLGGGDIKLFGVCGLYLGFTASLFAVLLSCIIGLIYGIIQKNRVSEQIPLGPAIALSAFLMYMYGNTLVTWYLQMLY